MFRHPPIVKDTKLNEQLFQKGYITLPFLDAAAVVALRKIYFDRHGNDTVEGLYVSSKGKPWNELLEISNAIKGVIEPSVDLYFQNVQKIGGAFVVKTPDKNGILQPHQDWSIVDENRYRSFAIWIALQDTDDHNGAMYVLPGSHEWIRGYRHITIPSVYGKVYDLTWKYMVPVHLKAGEAVVFDHSLAHASKPNISDRPRIASVNTIISENATFRICCNHNGVVEEYECPSDFYVKPEAQNAPFDLPKIKNTDFKMVQLDEEKFLRFAKKEGLVRGEAQKKSILNRIKQRFLQ